MYYTKTKKWLWPKHKQTDRQICRIYKDFVFLRTLKVEHDFNLLKYNLNVTMKSLLIKIGTNHLNKKYIPKLMRYHY